MKKISDIPDSIKSSFDALDREVRSYVAEVVRQKVRDILDINVMSGEITKEDAKGLIYNLIHFRSSFFKENLTDIQVVRVTPELLSQPFRPTAVVLSNYSGSSITCEGFLSASRLEAISDVLKVSQTQNLPYIDLPISDLQPLDQLYKKEFHGKER